MLLDRIAIDSHGPLSRVALGPFSQTLNAIVSASGSGKTALVRFLRDSLTGTTPARDGLAQSIGRVVWTAADGFYHCRREPNGTAQGRRFVEFESRNGNGFGNSKYGRDAIVVDLPASVVDGIVTDTELTNISRCVQAAIASGLDHTSAGHDSSRQNEINDLRREIAELERQIHSHSLHSKHASARQSGAYDSFGLTPDMKRLRDRRAELALEISAIDARRDWAGKADAEMDRRRRKRDLFATIADDLERLRRQESDLRMRLAEVESSLEKMDDDATRAENRASIAKAYRNRLEQVDAHLVRVRRVVREVRALGDHWFGGRGLTAQAGWLDQAIDGVTRVVEDFSIDQDSSVSGTNDERGELNITDRGWSAALASEMRIDDSVAASTVDVQRRIDAICRLVDNLVGRCEEHQSERVHPQYDGNNSERAGNSRVADWDSWAEAELRRIDRNSPADSSTMTAGKFNGLPVDPADAGERFDPTRGLDRAERLLQEERNYRNESVGHSGENVSLIASTLNGISQRLRGLAGRHAAYGSSNVDPLFHSRRDEHSLADISNYGSKLDPQAQIAAVRRCERELVEVLRHLVSRRELMLRRIAEVQNQPLSQVVSAMSDTQVCHDDPQLYQWLVRDRITASEADAKQREAEQRRLTQQRTDLIADLKRTISRTTDRVAEAETIRVYLRSLPVVHRHDDDANLRARLVAEIKSIDEQLAKPRVHPAILERHALCVTRLRSLTASGPQLCGLAAAASEYLQKLSGGQLRSVAWHRGTKSGQSLGVEIDGRSEATCKSTERFIAAVAVRLAAADELARRGRALPVIIETPSLRQLFNDGLNHDLRSLMQTGLEVLVECARNGRQIVLLTDDAVIADAVMRAGGAVQSIHGTNALNANMLEVNRDFDVAWHEANGDDSTWRRDDHRSSDSSVDDFQDNPANIAIEKVSHGRVEATESPFFLTGLSSIDQAPSIDANAAAQLRAVGIIRIEHLLAASPKELAESLRTNPIDAATIRRWQNECRLVCGVRKLSGFDARVLVGCGITHPSELTEIDRQTLTERVNAFLATERGERIMRSGTSQEIARLNAWINQAQNRPTTRVSTPPRVAAPNRMSTLNREPSVNRTTNRTERATDSTLKFYLQRSSDVEAGPSIGPRMAERLHRIGVKTVDQLVTRSASSIADALKLSKVDAAMVRSWQQQALLVCRVPQLRGHDAQLLVAAGITEPERLAECEASWLLKQIDPIASSREGKAILRGGKHPDLAEMREWIANAQSHRDLVAA